MQDLLSIMEIRQLKILHVHNVQWLSMDQIIEQMASIMPTILSVFDNPSGCGELGYGFQCHLVLFFIHLLVDVLEELNNTLNNIF